MKTKYKRKVTVNPSDLLESLKNFPIVIKTYKSWKRISFQTLYGKPLQIIKRLSNHPYYMIILPTLSSKRKNKFYVNYEN